jgi:succinyl-diaminopimelate desuccinylase
MIKMKKQLEAYLEKHLDEMLQDVVRLCRIDSVKGPEAEGMPYGPGPYAALMEMREICRKYGFQTANYDNRVVTADFGGAVPCLDILAHMDVVAPGDGWTVTEAFEPRLSEDALYGRGTSDDKGPAVAALYAMRAVRELGIPLEGRCRLILGSDEECGSSDLPFYYKKEKEAPMSFSPDAEFPVINIEKGQFRGTISLSYGTDGSSCLLQGAGGNTINIVPQYAEADLSGVTETELMSAAEDVRRETGAVFTAKAEKTVDGYGREICRIRITGKAAHASTPKEGVNAAILLLQLLSRLPESGSEWQQAVRKFASLFPYGDHKGAALGIARSDSLSGDTSVSLDILEIRDGKICAKFDARTCVTADEANTAVPLQSRLEENGMEFSRSFVPPHAVDGQCPFVQTLLACYEEVTGKKGSCIAIGGGTYVHTLQNGVAFGAVGADTDTHMHGADEFMPVRELLDAALIYALAIVRLCGAQEDSRAGER